MDEIDDMIVEEDYQWALDTIDGIYETVGRNEHCTNRQKEAIQNIIAAVERKRR